MKSYSAKPSTTAGGKSEGPADRGSVQTSHAATSGITPKSTKTGRNEYRSTSHPVTRLKIIPPIPDPILANPQMEATAPFGNTSPGIASRFASAPEYPKVAIEIRAMHCAALSLFPTKTADTIRAEKMRTAPRRAVAALAPVRKSTLNTAPPARFPMVAVKNGIQAVAPISRSENEWATFRYCGNQKA